MFGTLQDRLPKELALAGITTVEAANDWLREVYLPDHNARFAIAAEQEGWAFVMEKEGAGSEDPWIQEERRVGNDIMTRGQSASCLAGAHRSVRAAGILMAARWQRGRGCTISFRPSATGRMTRSARRSVPGHAPAQSKNGFAMSLLW